MMPRKWNLTKQFVKQYRQQTTLSLKHPTAAAFVDKVLMGANRVYLAKQFKNGA